MITGFSHKQNRLNHQDMALYGQQPDQDAFTVVTCLKCGMVLKQQAYYDHHKKRHSFDSLAEAATMSMKFSIKSENEPMTKRRRIDQSLSHKPSEPRIDNNFKILSNSLDQSPTDILSYSKNVLKPCSKTQNDHEYVLPCRPQPKNDQRERLQGMLVPQQHNKASNSKPAAQARRICVAPKKMTPSHEKSDSFVQSRHHFIAPQQVKTESTLRIKMKLKKSDHGMWSVVTA